ncbi:MAG: VWA domain-containing protein [Alphaproteobacteria bacterium]
MRKSKQVSAGPSNKLPASEATGAEIADFISQIQKTPKPASGGRGRLIFAMDATMSRQPTWDRACALQAEMFQVTAAIGGLDVQLVYFRGFGECKASRWVGDGASLATIMSKIECRGGYTQLGRILKHALDQAAAKPVGALVYVGDCLEEPIDPLAQLAGELGLVKVPVFMFHEGGEATAALGFREIARLSGGAYCHFDAGAAGQLRDLLRAVAVYASGGRIALENFEKGRGAAKQLLEQMR